MKDTILGYDWTDIQRAQQGGSLARAIDTSNASAPEVTDEDRALLAEHGVDRLEFMGYHGVIDRLSRAGLIPPKTCIWKKTERGYLIGCQAAKGVTNYDRVATMNCCWCGHPISIQNA